MSDPSALLQQERLNKAAIVIRRLQEKLTTLEKAEQERVEPIAIIGLGCRFPGGAESPAAFWELLSAGRDAIQPLDARWALVGAVPGADVPHWAGLLTGPIDRFDAGFFGISPREALTLDPQHRLLLEVTWEALEDAGICPPALQGSRTSVFLGAASTDYREIVTRQPSEEQDAYTITGNLLSVAAGRLSYTFGLQGPCLTVDTACSSSLVAVHLACRSLRARESDLALAGGVNVILSPEMMGALGQTQALSPEGRCKTFDALANGFARGEGCGMLVLKRVSDAKRDGDRIWALIRGSAVNQDGKSTGLTAPNVLSQEALLREALREARLEAGEIGYIETHGTGTSLGDPIEVEALRRVMGPERADGSACVLGAVKTNIGHLEAAAGVAGLMKAVLTLHHERIVANLHCRSVNPRLRLEGTALKLANGGMEWRRGERVRYAGVSAFGMSGTNAHVVLEEGPKEEAKEAAEEGASERGAEVVVLSARSEEALVDAARRLKEHLEVRGEVRLRDVAWSLGRTRSEFKHRLSVVVRTREELVEKLCELGKGETPPGAYRGVVRGGGKKVAFMMAGQGSQQVGMGRELHRAYPAFRAALDRCAKLFEAELERPLLEVMWGEAGSEAAKLLDQTAYTQAALFTLEMALYEQWRAWGVEPEVLAGHSIGEVAAACAAGVFTLEDGVKLVGARGRLMQRLPGAWGMVSIEAGEAEVAAVVAGAGKGVTIAAVNGPQQVVIAGEKEAVEGIGLEFMGMGKRSKVLRVSHGFHSAQMEGMQEGLRVVAEGLEYRRAGKALVSGVSGKLDGGEMSTAEYWVRQVREAVRYGGSIETMVGLGVGTYIELGATAGLLGLVGGQVPEGKAVLVASQRSGREGERTLLEGVGVAWVSGIEVKWTGVFADGGVRVPLPSYPWQRQRYWLKRPDPDTLRTGEATGHPLLGQQVPVAGATAVFETFLGLGEQPWLGDHRVAEKVVVPGAAVAELVRAAAAHRGSSTARVDELLLQAPLVLPESGASRIQVVLTERAEEPTMAAVYGQPAGSRPGSVWTLHATAAIQTSEDTPSPAATLDLAAVQARCSDSLDVDEIYARFAKLGIAYGPAFRGMRALWRGPGEALAELAVPQGIASAGYGVLPSVLDASFHAVIATLDEGRTEEMLLPFAMGSFVVVQPGALVAWAHVRSSDNARGGAVIADITLVDAAGEVVARVTELQLQPASREALRRADKTGQAPADVFYRLEWRETPLPEVPPRQPDGHWIVVAVAGSARAARLSAHLGHASCTEPAGLVAALEREPSPAGVICLWEAGPEEDIPAAALRVATDGLAVVHALQGHATARLFWVTSRAIAVEPGEMTVVSTAPAWGLGRTVMQEQPELGCTLVDLDAGSDWMDVLARELTASGDENQVAWRAGRRLAARLVRLARSVPDHEDSEQRRSQGGIGVDGTVLLTGGLGALGRHVARWLARQGVQHLLLTGRRGLDTPGAAEVVSELEAGGTRVTVAPVDVADRAALDRVIQTIPRELPLRGVVHAAGVLDDGVLAEQSAARFARVFAGKVVGAWNLHVLTAGHELSFFVLFSSAVGLLGAAGQGNYAAANSFLDALAAQRRAQGLSAHSLAWGAWSEGGMAASLGAAQQARLARQGVESLSPAEGIALLESALGRPEAYLGLMRMDLRAVGRAFGAHVPPLWRGLVRATATRTAAGGQGSWAARLAALPAATRADEVRAAVQSEVARVLSWGAGSRVPVDRPLQELGLDSLMAVELRNALGQRVGATLPATLAFNYPTVEAITGWLLGSVLAAAAPAAPAGAAAAQAASEEPIAIVGMACRLPGGVTDPDSFWRLLDLGIDAISEVPRSRWDIDALYDPDPDAPGKMITRYGGFLSDIDCFDPAFFGISPREAASMDPQQRLLLETSWEALENAGIVPERLMGSDTGVFVGLMYQEYASLVQGLEAMDGYVGTGTTGSVASGRISYVLGLKGPSLTVDTACSSSLVTVHLACQALRQGECTAALAGGVALMLTPATFVEFSRLRGLAPDGRCKSFSAAADGAAWSEGCGMLVLKRLGDAQRDGDPILGVIRGSAVNQDGRSNGLTAPNGPSQEAVIRRALLQAGVAAGELDYVECHGTGTPLGDPIEAQALGAVMAGERPADRPLLIGSVKSNLGHTQAAAGAAGLMKVVLAMQHGRLPRSLHFAEPSPHIRWSELALRVVAEAVEWPKGPRPRRAGVSSFGVSGTNAHVVVEEAPEAVLGPSAPERSAELVVLSARSAGALNEAAARLCRHLEGHPEQRLEDVAFSLATTRSAQEYRLAVVGSSRETVKQVLAAAGEGETPAGVVRGRAEAGQAKVVFVFPGQGGQWAGMGRQLLAEEAEFRRSLEAIDRAIAEEAGWSLLAELEGSERGSELSGIEVVQPMLFAMGVGLAALWRSWGVEPDVVVGHSLGEVAAAHVAGALTLKEAVAVICRRSQLLSQISGRGEMAQVELTAVEAEAAVSGYADRLSVAVSNGPRTTVIAGERAALGEVLEKLTARGVYCRRIKVDVASHSPQVDGLLPALRSALSELRPAETKIPMRSTVSGGEVKGPELVGSYWAENLRQPVRFGEVVQGLQGAGYSLFVELGPHPVLAPAVEEMRVAAGVSGAAVGSTRRGQEERQALLESVGTLWTAGYEVAWERLFAGGRRVPLPTYPWQRARYWLEAPKGAGTRSGEDTGHPLLGVRVPAAGLGAVFESLLGLGGQPWLGDHRVAGQIVVPGVAVAELIRAAAEHGAIGAPRVTRLVLRVPLVLPETGARRCQVVIAERVGEALAAAVYSSPADGGPGAAWTLHATATLAPEEAVTRPAALDLKALRARCVEALDVDALYASLIDVGIAYGAAFRGLRSLWRGHREALAEVRLPAGAPSEGYGASPALFDAALQAAVAAVPVEVLGELLLPFEIGGFTLYEPGIEAAWVHVRLHADDDLTVDLTLTDDAGTVVAEVSELRFQHADRRALRTGTADALDEAFCRLSFRKAPLLDAPGAPPEGVWVVVGGAGSTAAAQLSARLGSSVSTEPSHLAAVLAQSAPIAGVICLWEADPTIGIPTAAQQVAIDGLTVVQTLQGRAKVRLFWVTQGAVAVQEGDVLTPQAVATAPAWGLGRTVMSEHPELGCRLIDLGAGPDALDALLRELSARDDEDQVAWRAGQRYVARLLQAEAAPPKERVSLPTQGTVLLTGGLGGLGLQVARWLAREGVPHLLLTSRRGLGTPGAEDAVRELEALGARVTVAAVDVADLAGLAAVLRAIPAELPLRGVVHAAGVLDDGVLSGQNAERFARVLSPKVVGAWNLHALTAEQDLDFFVLFSSFSGVFGAAGQGNYAAANTFLDALAAHRRTLGLPAQSLAWGAWSEVGRAAQFDVALQARRGQKGMGALSPAEGIALFARALSRPEALLGVASMDLRGVRRSFGAAVPPLWRALIRAPAVRSVASTQQAWSARLATLPQARRAEEVRAAVQSEVARVLSWGAGSRVPVDRPLQELGLDSLMAVELRNALGQRVGATLPATLAFNYPTVEAITGWLLGSVLAAAAPAAPAGAAAAQAASEEPIAIVGMACRLPGGVTDPDSFWRLLDLGIDAISEVPRSRWDIDALYDPDPDAPGKMITRYGGFLSDIDCFDPAFFGISPREAASMDPQQRLLLETSWEALENAGIVPERLMGSDTGVFVGLMYQEYASLVQGLEAMDGYVGTGTTGSVASGRISYVLGLKGPSLTVDTACSSSLVTVHLACQALRQGECTAALAGGVALMLTPATFVEFSRLRGLAPDGRCKSFSAAADGAAWSEGCGMLVLKRLGDAQRDGDPILGVIRGSAVNQDGRSNGLTAPNGPSQEAVIRRALLQAGVAAGELDYVECHGTGTPLGDPIEAQALGAVMAGERPADRPLLIGSVKSNLGHTQAAAGAAGLMKVVLAMQHGRLPRSLHFAEPSPHIRWSELALRVVAEAVEWPKGPRPRRAGVSSFGVSGTNAHVVVEEAPEAVLGPSAPERSAELVVLSARSAGALNEAAARLCRHLEGHPEQRLEDVAFSLATTRSAQEYRLAVVGSSRETVKQVLAAAGEGETPAGVVRGRAEAGQAKVVFVFPGQGGQWAGMGRQLLAEEAEFRRSLEAIDRAIAEEAGWSLLAELEGSERGSELSGIEVVQPMLFAMGVGLAALWRSWGVEPDVVVGHSLGEVAAAHVAGALTLKEAVAVICRRSQLLSQISGRGEMAQVELTAVEAEAAVSGYADRLSVAVSNGPRTTVIAGERAALGEVLEKLTARGVYCRRIKVDVASHSPQVDGLLPALRSALSELRPAETKIPMRSTVSGGEVKGPELVGSYWAENLRQPVRFGEVVQGLQGAGYSLFVELGPHPVLAPAVEEMRVAAGVSGAAVGSTRRGQEERQALLESVGTLWTAGYEVAWERLFAGGRRVPLPTYPWQRARYWLEAPKGAGDKSSHCAAQAVGHPILGEGRTVFSYAGLRLWEATLDRTRLPWLTDHWVQGAMVLPFAATLEMALGAGAEVFAGSAIAVTDVMFVEAIGFVEDDAIAVQLVTTQDGPAHARFEIGSRAAGQAQAAWRVHARGVLSRAEHATSVTLDTARLRAQLGQVEPASTTYAALEALGLEYGPAFQGIVELWLGDGEALGCVRPRAPTADATAAYQIHPVALEACFQVLARALRADDGRMWIPVELGSLRLWQPPRGELWCHARVAPRRAQDPDERRVAELWVVDGTGARVAEITGLVMQRSTNAPRRRTARQAALAMQTDGGPWIREQLARTAPEAREPLLVTLLGREVARVLRVEESEIDVNVPLTSLGLSSLLGLELRQALARSAAVDVPLSRLLYDMTIIHLAQLVSAGTREAAGDSTEQSESDTWVSIEL